MNETVVTVCGNLAADPEHIRTDAGLDIVKFRIGCSPRVFDKGSQQFVDGPTSWYTVSAFRSLGLNCMASLNRGERVVVTGRLKVSQWTNDEKQRTYTNADIDATAVGHDLTWGTTSFQRVVRTERIERPGQDESDAMSERLAERWAQGEDLPRVDADGVIHDPEEEPARV